MNLDTQKFWNCVECNTTILQKSKKRHLLSKKHQKQLQPQPQPQPEHEPQIHYQQEEKEPITESITETTKKHYRILMDDFLKHKDGGSRGFRGRTIIQNLRIEYRQKVYKTNYLDVKDREKIDRKKNKEWLLSLNMITEANKVYIHTTCFMVEKRDREHKEELLARENKKEKKQKKTRKNDRHRYLIPF